MQNYFQCNLSFIPADNESKSKMLVLCHCLHGHLGSKLTWRIVKQLQLLIRTIRLSDNLRKSFYLQMGNYVV